MAQQDPLIINEAQLILAEKRTSLAALRTGIAIIALPLAVASVLIVASRYYNLTQVLGLMIPVLVLCTALAVLGTWLVVRSLVKLHREELMLKELKRRHSIIAEFMD